MAPNVFQIGPSPFAPFLQAPVGVEGNGMDLSVLSALARLGKDPWAEAARLADLPQLAAVDRLAGFILALSGPGWPVAEATATARHLVKLLPAHARPDGPAQPGAGTARVRGHRTSLVLAGAAIGAAVMFAVLVGLAPRLSGPSYNKLHATVPAANTGQRATTSKD